VPQGNVRRVLQRSLHVNTQKIPIATISALINHKKKHRKKKEQVSHLQPATVGAWVNIKRAKDLPTGCVEKETVTI